MSRVLPAAALTQHLAVLGKTGSGKSSCLRLLVEGLLEDGKPLCIIDPKGDWWGLKSSADGKRPGYPVLIFGGEHADVPLNAHAGAPVAELIASGNRPCIIDLGGWMVGDRTRFFVEFASTLFRHSRVPRWLVIDEVHNFAPQGRVQDPEAGKMLHWANRLASEGRGKGLTIFSASQRPQKVHKDFLTCAETLIAMRVIHPLDRNAIRDWIDGCPDAEKGREVLQSLASMARGTGWVWSPEIGFGPVRVEFPKFATYDSFKAPTGELEKLKGWAEVDLEEVKVRLAEVVKQAEADDPRVLRQRIMELEKAGGKASPRALHDAESTGYSRGLIDGRTQLAEVIRPHLGMARTAWEGVFGVTRDVDLAAGTAKDANIIPKVFTKRQPERSGKVQFDKQARSQDSEIGTGGLRRMLTALAQRPQGLSRKSLGVRSTMSSRSGTFSTYLGRANASGWIERSGDQFRITKAGLAALGDFVPLPTGSLLLAHWIGELGDSGASRLLMSVADRYPRSITKSDAAVAANLSESSGTFSTYLGRLRALELVHGRSDLVASEEFFR